MIRQLHLFPTDPMLDTPHARAMQRAIYTAADAYIEHHGYPPSMRELAERTGLRSTSSVAVYLAQLRYRGCVTWVDGRARTLVLIKPPPSPFESAA